MKIVVELTEDQFQWLNRVCRFHVQVSENKIAADKTRELIEWLYNFEPTNPVFKFKEYSKRKALTKPT